MATATSVINPSVPQNLVDMLRRDEGYVRLPERDTRGNLFIGYGFDIQTVGLSEIESYLVLTYRASETKTTLIKTLPWTGSLDAPRQDALANMAYNLGIAELCKFTTFLALCAQGKWELAADDLASTAWYDEVGARAHRLSVQLRTGVRQ